MDVGNGGFVFLSGLAYRRISPSASVKNTKPRTSRTWLSALGRWMKIPQAKALALVAMGIVRCMLTKLVVRRRPDACSSHPIASSSCCHLLRDHALPPRFLQGYQEHVSEYGTHWNFFVTLGCVTFVACVFLRSASNAVAVSVVGLAFLGLSGSPQPPWLQLRGRTPPPQLTKSR